MYTATEKLLIAAKWLSSFAKSKWSFGDYPLRVRRNGTQDASIAWMAQFLKWPGPIGLGPTPDAAIEQLRANFEDIVQIRATAGDALPRPGTVEWIRFAPAEKVNRNPELLDDFIERVFGFPPGSPVFVSDGSSLHDFGTDEDIERFHGLIRSVYQVETSDLSDGLITDILDRIDSQRTPPTPLAPSTPTALP